MSRIVFFWLILMLPLANGVAHDLYILPESFDVTGRSSLSVAVHDGDAFPQSEVSPVLARLKDAQLLSANQRVRTVNGLRESASRAVGTVTLPGRAGNYLLSVRTVPHFIELPPDQFLSYLQEEGLTAVIDWRAQHGESTRPGRERYAKFAKSLLVSGGSDDFYGHEIGLPIEIIPETNPYSLHAGGSMSVRVVFNGKPAVDLPLEAAWTDGRTSKTIIVGRTNSHGRIEVPLAAAGKWRLHALLMQPCADKNIADWESYWASFTFELR
jgi:hypothetical protein